MAGIGILRTIEGGSLGFWCPGCEGMHVVNVEGVHPDNEVWGWNRSYDLPTFTPSVLVRGGHYLFGTRWAPGKVLGKDPCWCTYNAEHPNEPAPFKCDVCHSFVTDGRIQFLGDCTHALAGQTVQLQKPHHWEDDMTQLKQEEGEAKSTGGVADTTVPPVGEPNPGTADAEASKAPPPNPAERIQEQAELATAANALEDAGVKRDAGEGIGQAEPLVSSGPSPELSDEVVPQPEVLLLIKEGDTIEVRVEANGRMVLNGREVDSQQDFRSAMTAIARVCSSRKTSVNAEYAARTSGMDLQEVTATMRRSIIELESAIALGVHEVAREAQAFLEHCAAQLKRHIP